MTLRKAITSSTRLFLLWRVERGTTTHAPPLRHREDPALDAGDVAIQSPSFQQEDWIASSAKASSQ